MIGVALDSPSDSLVSTRGATSVPSMPALSGNPILPCTAPQTAISIPAISIFEAGVYNHQHQQTPNMNRRSITTASQVRLF